ncbi:uncharacterized protein LOC105774048 isoform X3 [Gossypium raimondii]|uniref:PXMP2/4 family protein 2 n=1 Tax=Gossypium raimondii TaxID=29730 RepID=A0A0D2V6V5_GOSRA|nr:uncharacterized protein LOC105774048 isoform X3 [Gossypium raimondii]KJB64915.1 hypothetical protein B456_010G072100 [Gossypium raimondii]
MLRIWKWYQSCLSLHPVKTQIISSGFLWGIGDVAAQYITHSTAKKRLQYHKDDDNEFKVNWKRVAVTSMFGFGFVGPVGHFWYEGLDKFIKMRLLLRPKSASRKKHCSSEGRREERLPPSLDIGRWRLANRSDSAFLSWIEQQKDAPWKQRFTSFTSMKEGGGQGRL